MQKYELLLRKARIIDPANKVDGIRDIAISKGKMVRACSGAEGSSSRS